MTLRPLAMVKAAEGRGRRPIELVRSPVEGMPLIEAMRLLEAMRLAKDWL